MGKDTKQAAKKSNGGCASDANPPARKATSDRRIFAAGSVGASHKSYYAAQLRDGGDWLMLELVLHWEARAVHATFRCGDPTWLTRLADHFASHLGRALRVNFAA